jgi:hypothetical protein
MAAIALALPCRDQSREDSRQSKRSLNQYASNVTSTIPLLY